MMHYLIRSTKTLLSSDSAISSIHARHMRPYHIGCIALQTCVLAILLMLQSNVLANDLYNGSWAFNKKRSDNLKDVMQVIRRENQEEIDQREEEKQKRNSKPDVFGKNREWDDRRARGATAPIPRLMRNMISADVIKIYFSRKLAISYDNEIKRLLTPNPNGRVYSATGAGLSKDSVGETLSYIEKDILHIETRTDIGRIKERIDPISEPGKLIITWTIEAPAIERPVDMITVYDKK